MTMMPVVGHNFGGQMIHTLLLITFLTSVLLSRNVVHCEVSSSSVAPVVTPVPVSLVPGEDKTQSSIQNIQPVNEKDTESLTRAGYLSQQLSKTGLDIKESNPDYTLEKFLKTNDWDKVSIDCKPTTETDPLPHWDDCLRSTVEMVNGTILTFLGFILNCNPDATKPDTGICGCMPDTVPVKNFTVNGTRTACLMENVKVKEECISPWECENEHHCMFNQTAGIYQCQNSSTSISTGLFLTFIVSMIVVLYGDFRNPLCSN